MRAAGVDQLAAHLALDDAPDAYRDFAQKANGTIEVLLHP